MRHSVVNTRTIHFTDWCANKTRVNHSKLFPNLSSLQTGTMMLSLTGPDFISAVQHFSIHHVADCVTLARRSCSSVEVKVRIVANTLTGPFCQLRL